VYRAVFQRPGCILNADVNMGKGDVRNEPISTEYQTLNGIISKRLIRLSSELFARLSHFSKNLTVQIRRIRTNAEPKMLNGPVRKDTLYLE
jgi:hypothetical protein